MTTNTGPSLENINTISLFEFSSNGSLFFGAMNLDHTVFYPFFNIVKADTKKGLTEIIVRSENEYCVARCSIELFNKQFTKLQIERPEILTNTELYHYLYNVLQYRKYGCVKWIGEDEDFGKEGTVMKIKNNMMKILWTEQTKDSKSSLSEYPLDCPAIEALPPRRH